MRFKLKPGQAIVYPSDTLHEVEPVTKGERLVAITFIQSRVKDPFQRHMLFELNEVAALEGLKMDPENFSRLQLVQANLLRCWGDSPRLSRLLQMLAAEQLGDLDRVQRRALAEVVADDPQAEAVLDRRVLADAADT